MSILSNEVQNIKIPRLHRVKQLFPDEKLSHDDIKKAIQEEINSEGIRERIKPGDVVAILVGSRGIASLKEVVAATVGSLKALGAKPIIIPAMGSHGGAQAQGQVEILADYGVTEEYVGAPVKSSMDTVIIAYTSEKIPIHIDRVASEADLIVPIGRVKPHTDFEGPIESGLCKMLAIGLGKHNGCARLHQEGFINFSQLIPEVASIILKEKDIPFGIALVENAHESLHSIHVIPSEKILFEEARLLSLSKSIMPKLQFGEIDVLIVERIGKDISGSGMDPNITGKMAVGRIDHFSGPFIKRIVVLDLTASTHGNATGIGCADFITKSLFEKADLISTYTNCVSAGTPEAGKMPVMFEDEEDAVRAAIQTAPHTDFTNPKIVKIKSTLHLIDIEVSPTLLEECKKRPDNFDIPAQYGY